MRKVSYDLGMTNHADHLSTPALKDQLTSSAPGLRRKAELLLQVPDFDRAILSQEWTYRLNTIGAGWRPSDLLSRIVNEYLDRGLDCLTSPTAKAM